MEYRKWFKFWKKSGPNESYIETYKVVDMTDVKKVDEEKTVKCEVASWAETVGGGFNSHYSYGFERVIAPPLAWLEKEKGRIERNIEWEQGKLALVKREISKIDNKKKEKTEDGR